MRYLWTFDPVILDQSADTSLEGSVSRVEESCVREMEHGRTEQS